MSTVTTEISSSRHAVIGSPIGPLTVVADDDGVCGLYFPHHWTGPDPATFGPAVDASQDATFGTVGEQLDGYFAGDRQAFELPVSLHGSDLSQRVWRLLSAIPYGETTTYGELAREIGGGISARAIGGFVGRNPVSIVVPCHRVVGSTGKLTGYAGGLERKQRLLELEGAIPSSAPALW